MFINCGTLLDMNGIILCFRGATTTKLMVVSVCVVMVQYTVVVVVVVVVEKVMTQIRTKEL
jgi:hypothetical protein